MTDISVAVTNQRPDKRVWLLGPAGTGPGETPSIMLNLSLFTKATHYPDGYLPSGIVLGYVTETGHYGPYDKLATDGRQTAAGLLYSSVTVPITTPPTTRVPGAMLVRGSVSENKLPIAWPAIGSIDAAARTSLKGINFTTFPHP